MSESGLYRMVLRSQREEAERFQDWVTDDVIPSIRRTGSYSVPGAAAIPTTFAEALQLAADQAKALEAKDTEIARLGPSAVAFDVLASTDRDYKVGDAAKILNRDPGISTGQNRLFRWMAEHKLIYQESDGRRREWKPYQQHVDAGRFTLRMGGVWEHPKTGKTEGGAPQLRVTTKGVAYLHRLLGGLEPVQFGDSAPLTQPQGTGLGSRPSAPAQTAPKVASSAGPRPGPSL